MKKYIIALDEGTTSARTLVYDLTQNKIINIVNEKFKQYFDFWQDFLKKSYFFPNILYVF